MTSLLSTIFWSKNGQVFRFRPSLNAASQTNRNGQQKSKSLGGLSNLTSLLHLLLWKVAKRHIWVFSDKNKNIGTFVKKNPKSLKNWKNWGKTGNKVHRVHPSPQGYCQQGLPSHEYPYQPSQEDNLRRRAGGGSWWENGQSSINSIWRDFRSTDTFGLSDRCVVRS